MKTATLLLLAAATSFAVVPHRFSSGTPAKADSVNENFDYLEAAVKAKANQAGLDSVKVQLSSGSSAAGKANQSSLDSLKALLGAKADTASLSALKGAVPGPINLSGYAKLTDLGAKADTSALNAVKASIPSAVNLGAYATTVSVNQSLGAKADTAALNAVKASIPAAANLSGYAKIADLGAKADTSALNAVKASIPASANLSGYATISNLNDTAIAIRGSFPSAVNLTGYAKLVDLASYAKATDLEGYATTSSLTGYAKATDLAGYALASSLSSYATTANLNLGLGKKVDTLALTTRLNGYLTSANLSGYATTSSLSAYAKTTDLATYALTSSLSSYATTANLNLGLGKKVDTLALTTRLNGYLTSANLSGYATTSSLSVYAKTADLASYAKTTSLAAYATNAALGLKADADRSVVFATAGGAATLPNSASILFSQDANNGFGSYVDGNSIGFYSASDNGSVYLRKNPAAIGVNLSYSNRGGNGDIFTSTLNGVTFPSTVNIGGVLNFSNTNANATGTMTFPQDATSGFGTYISATDIGFYSGSDAGNIYLRKNPAAIGFSLSYANRGGSGDFFTTNLTGTSFPKKVTVAGDLVVKGNTIAMGIPESNVADYVFEPAYKLAPLTEVEAYTQEHKHLPEVPSASEIAKGGLNLTEMNLTLLKKVEELTLHAIAQNKQLESQAAQIQAQNDRLRALESRSN